MASTDPCPCYVACWPILILSSLYIIRRVLEGVSTLDGLRATGTESQGNRVDAGDDSHAQAWSTCKNTLKGGTASITLTVLQLSINFGRCFTALRTALNDAYFFTECNSATKWDQKLLRARMVDTFDAGKAGCSASAFEAAAYDPQEKGAAKRAFAAARVRNFTRTPAMTFVDEGLEAEYVHWQARQRWQVWPRAQLLVQRPVLFGEGAGGGTSFKSMFQHWSRVHCCVSSGWYMAACRTV